MHYAVVPALLATLTLGVAFASNAASLNQAAPLAGHGSHDPGQYPIVTKGHGSCDPNS